jgi:ribosomal protein S30
MGKVHGSLARAGKVRGQTPKVAKQARSVHLAPRTCCTCAGCARTRKARVRVCFLLSQGFGNCCVADVVRVLTPRACMPPERAGEEEEAQGARVQASASASLPPACHPVCCVGKPYDLNAASPPRRPAASPASVQPPLRERRGGPGQEEGPQLQHRLRSAARRKDGLTAHHRWTRARVHRAPSRAARRRRVVAVCAARPGRWRGSVLAGGDWCARRGRPPPRPRCSPEIAWIACPHAWGLLCLLTQVTPCRLAAGGDGGPRTLDARGARSCARN